MIMIIRMQICYVPVSKIESETVCAFYLIVRTLFPGIFCDTAVYYYCH